jgi:hypothetical protein
MKVTLNGVLVAGVLNDRALQATPPQRRRQLHPGVPRRGLRTAEISGLWIGPAADPLRRSVSAGGASRFHVEAAPALVVRESRVPHGERYNLYRSLIPTGSQPRPQQDARRQALRRP